MEDLDNIIILTDEFGGECQFEFLDLLEYCGEEYVILLPAEEDPDGANEVIILKLEDAGPDSESYVGVEDENVLQGVFDLFKEKHKRNFNFID